MTAGLPAAKVCTDGSSLIGSDYKEVVDHPQLGRRRGFPPFLRKELVKVFAGRFCFDYGEGAGCGVKVDYTVGQMLELTMGLGGAGGLSASVKATHTVTTALGWEVGECDSLRPVICYRDAEAHLWATRALLGPRHRVRALETEFVRGKEPPTIYPKRFRNDPDCDCASDLPPLEGTDEPVREAPSPGSSKLVQFLDVEPVEEGGSDSRSEDPTQVAAQAAELLEASIAPNLLDDEYAQEAGVVGVDGEVNWLVGDAAHSQPPRLSILPTDPVGLFRGAIGIGDRNNQLPLLCFGPRVDEAEYARVEIRHSERDGSDSVVLPVEARMDEYATVWGELDVSRLPDEARGEILVQLVDGDGAGVGVRGSATFQVLPEPLAAPLVDV